MRALLNSLGLTLWSSIAIVLAVGLAMVGYRVSLSMKICPDDGASSHQVAPAPLFAFPSVEPSSGSMTPAAHAQSYSRVIEPEMRRAQAALQAGQWQEALDDVQVAERKQGVTIFDAKTINHFKAYAHLQLHNYSAALMDSERGWPRASPRQRRRRAFRRPYRRCELAWSRREMPFRSKKLNLRSKKPIRKRVSWPAPTLDPDSSIPLETIRRQWTRLPAVSRKDPLSTWTRPTCISD